MSEASPLGPSERASLVSPASGEFGRPKFRDRLKQIRAASRTHENGPPSNFGRQAGISPFSSPIGASFAPQEPAPAARPPETRASQGAVQPPFARSPSQPIPINPPPPMRQEPARANGIPLGPLQGPPHGPYAMPPQPSFPPQPQLCMTPEQQPRFMGRQMAVPVDVPLAVRTSQNRPHTLMRQTHAPHHPETSYALNAPKTASLTPYGLGWNEHTIGLAMIPRVADTYASVINYFRKPVEEFMGSEMPEEATIQEVKKLLSRINHISTHPDLDMDQDPEPFSQTSPEDEATWAEECSFKFQFLNHLFTIMRNDAAHVSIVARPGRTLNIIEKFLKGRGILYFRPDGKGSSLVDDQRYAGCRLEVSVVPSGSGGRNLAVKPAALVIAFDGSVNMQDPHILRMRSQPGVEWMMPAAHLLVYKSAEHIARCINPQLDETTRLRKIISYTTQLRHDVGSLLPEDMPVRAAAEEVAIALGLNGHQLKWSLPPIRAIPLDLIESSQDASTQDGSQSSDQDASSHHLALKRVWVGFL